MMRSPVSRFKLDCLLATLRPQLQPQLNCSAYPITMSLNMLADFAASVDLDVGSISPLPSAEAILRAERSLPSSLPSQGLGLDLIRKHLLEDIAPALNRESVNPNYYGFVTGGTTDAALYADWLVSAFDQNVQTFAPTESIAGNVEDAALRMLQQLLDIDASIFTGRTFTSGATASNTLGLALGREYSVQISGMRFSASATQASIARQGLIPACLRAGIQRIQVLSSMPHSSLAKAASIIGLGTDNVMLLPLSEAEPWRLDLNALEQHLSKRGIASIISVSAGEVNAGAFATTRDDMEKIRALADEYGAWVHVDAAFGLQARLLSKPQYASIMAGVAALDLADSITGDAHKLLNVPYDCGFFFTRHLGIQKQVFQNGSALPPDLSEAVPSAHNLGIENSRRLRALPVYATLVAYGRDWYRDLLERQISLARKVAEYISQSSDYELLPRHTSAANIYIIVLFRARASDLNSHLVQRLNSAGTIYVTGTQWENRPATRIAVSTWRVDLDRDSALIIKELEAIVRPKYSV
ncbi:unnamed protein product [Mycena citricolor]|uniref:Pyridoxal-dependent decarboxylase n=1 Tax=Mycena citricolor TaxID=2018698 RepID=A0AAD2K1X6_9AGAR|nr:unnamed protein product [Mycena citricolor]